MKKKNSIGTRIRIEPGCGGEESKACAALLLHMYQARASRYCAGWFMDGDILVVVSMERDFGRCEAGIHRFVRIAPSDSERRRHTSFVVVMVDGQTSQDQRRSYIFEPYKSVRDHLGGAEYADVERIVHDGFWPPYETAKDTDAVDPGAGRSKE